MIIIVYEMYRNEKETPFHKKKIYVKKLTLCNTCYYFYIHTQ